MLKATAAHMSSFGLRRISLYFSGAIPRTSFRSLLHTHCRPSVHSDLFPRRPSPALTQSLFKSWTVGGVRSIFIQTETTPNTDALKFLPNYQILPPAISSPFLEYLTPRSTLAPPHPSPLAARLLGIDGITSVFYGADFVTVTKEPDANWAHVKPEVFSLITEAVNSGEPFVNTVQDNVAAAGQQGPASDTLLHNENDSEVVGLIKELLDTKIRPAIQEDGGDVDYRGFKDGKVLLKLRGACRTCDSSTVTLRNGIENMLMHYIEEVKGIEQVLDQEEEIAMEEFKKFEENLKRQKGVGSTL